MAALAGVNFAVAKLAGIALGRVPELDGVSDQVELMLLELNLIKGFLKDADAKFHRNPQVKVWANSVTDVAYRIEDAMDTFLSENQGNKPQAALSAEMGKITQMLKVLFERANQLGIHKARDVCVEDNAPLPFRATRTEPCDFDDSEVVGLDSDERRIISHLLDTRIARRTVLSIVGVGGIGKTTLAQKLYRSSQLEKQFYFRTWLSISQKFNEKALLRELLYAIKPMKDEYPPVEDKDLLMEDKSYLSDKRYLIILDDVWKTDLWYALKKALPDANNGSRVIITTRSLHVAVAADRNTKPYQLHFLKSDESVALLFRKAFQRYIHPEYYSPSLKYIAERLTKKCGGLPLAVVVLGGILSTKEDTFDAWDRVCDIMNWHNEDGVKCMRILAMSYEELSDHLKPCFLYFATFPEDHNISAKQITRMWISEGLIPNDGAGSLEDRAEAYLQVLVQRCLVQVTQKARNGYCKYCRTHNLVRELAIHEAKQDNFFTIFSKEGDGSMIRR